MMQGLSPPADEDTTSSVRAWIEEWGHEVAAVDFAGARHRFAADVVAFGTHADIVRGVDALHEQQWSRVWPAIEGFAFRLDDLVVLASPDRLQAVAAVGWDSTGVAIDGQRFDRPGRATVVLRRGDTASPWIGVHTHFSLARGVSPSTHGAR